MLRRYPVNIDQQAVESFVRFVNDQNLVIRVPDLTTNKLEGELETFIFGVSKPTGETFQIDFQLKTGRVSPSARLQWVNVVLSGSVTRTSSVSGYHGRLTFQDLPAGEYRMSLSVDFSRKAVGRYEIDVEGVNAETTAHGIYAMQKSMLHQGSRIILDVVSANSRSCKVVIKGYHMENPGLHVRALLLLRGKDPIIQATQKVHRDQAIFQRLPKGNYRFEFFVPNADETQEGVI